MSYKSHDRVIWVTPVQVLFISLQQKKSIVAAPIIINVAYH